MTKLPADHRRLTCSHSTTNKSKFFGASEDTARLIEQAHGDDPAAFDALIFHVSGRLCAITHRMLADYPGVRRWEATDDVLQEVLVRLNRSLRQVKPQNPGSFFGLAITLVRRTLIDLSRHYFGIHGMGTHHKSDVVLANDGCQETLNHLQFLEPITDLDEWTAFHEAIERLPEPERETFSLKWYGGLTQRQIGELLEISERTVIRRIIRARTLLSGWLVDDDPLPQS